MSFINIKENSDKNNLTECDNSTPPIINDNYNKLLTRNMFKFNYVIGKGGFGKVWQVLYKKTKQPFALKEMSKRKILDKKSEKSINNEMILLKKLHHPFIVNMHYAFQDNDNLYLVIDFLSGGDLRYHCSRYRTFSEEQTRFFISCIICGLSHIHENNIIHRDIKPENLVLDDKGYLRITDFGIARNNKKDNSSETSGTPGYMSPEVMSGSNHSFSADFFAIGVIGYEFMMGKRPYNGKDRKEIKNKMLSKKIILKKSDMKKGWSIESLDFINQLLERKPEFRLGNKNGIKELIEHPWLKYYLWEELEKKELPAPFIPDQNDNFDKKYCDSIEIVTEDTKMRYKKIFSSSRYKNAFKSFFFNIDSEDKTIKKEEKDINKTKNSKDNENNEKNKIIINNIKDNQPNNIIEVIDNIQIKNKNNENNSHNNKGINNENNNNNEINNNNENNNNGNNNNNENNNENNNDNKKNILLNIKKILYESHNENITNTHTNNNNEHNKNNNNNILIKESIEENLSINTKINNSKNLISNNKNINKKEENKDNIMQNKNKTIKKKILKQEKVNHPLYPFYNYNSNPSPTISIKNIFVNYYNSSPDNCNNNINKRKNNNYKQYNIFHLNINNIKNKVLTPPHKKSIRLKSNKNNSVLFKKINNKINNINYYSMLGQKQTPRNFSNQMDSVGIPVHKINLNKMNKNIGERSLLLKKSQNLVNKTNLFNNSYNKLKMINKQMNNNNDYLIRKLIIGNKQNVDKNKLEFIKLNPNKNFKRTKSNGII